MASRRDPARDSRWVSTTADGRLGGDVADSLSQGVFILRKAPTVTKRVTARKSFFPLVPDETHEGMERRRDAYRACWAAADAHVSRVLAEANAEAFEKLEAFVKARFAERAEMRRANGGVVPQHVAQLIPVGLVLAGGVNSDDHEETFTKLTHHLRGDGMLLRSSDRATYAPEAPGRRSRSRSRSRCERKWTRSHRGRIRRRWWRRRRRRNSASPRGTSSRNSEQAPARAPTRRASPDEASDISSDGTAKSRKKTNRSIARKRRRRRRRRKTEKRRRKTEATETETEKTETETETETAAAAASLAAAATGTREGEDPRGRFARELRFPARVRSRAASRAPPSPPPRPRPRPRPRGGDSPEDASATGGDRGGGHGRVRYPRPRGSSPGAERRRGRAPRVRVARRGDVHGDDARYDSRGGGGATSPGVVSAVEPEIHHDGGAGARAAGPGARTGAVQRRAGAHHDALQGTRFFPEPARRACIS